MKIGNKNTDSFELHCIACGIDSNLTLTAFRNSLGEVTGWIVSCTDCQPDMSKDYEITLQKQEKS